jgi:RNA polymerase sigma-70 factor (sigma-E family)
MSEVNDSIRMTSTAQDALRQAFELHYVPLLRLAALLADNRQEAEDIVQGSFVRVATRIDELPQSETGPYLRTVVLNLWRTRSRRASFEHRIWPVLRPSAPPQDALGERDALWRALQALPPRQRACLVLRYYEDLPEREIARLLRCSVGTVKSQISRGLRRLREEYRDGT